MFLEEIATYLASVFATPVVPALVQGTNLTIGRMLDQPDQAVSLHEYTTAGGAYTLGGGNRRYEETGLQILVRDGEYNYLQARNLCERIINVLDGLTDVVLSGTRYMRIESTGTPLPMPTDPTDRVTFSINFTVMKELTVVSTP